MSFCNPGMIPIILGISVTFAVVLCYIIAVTTGHVTPFMPFISEAGGNMPESGIFTMGLAIVVFVGGNFMFIRYKLVDELNRSLGNSRLQFFNRISLLAGFLCLLGLLTVAAYPISTISSVHGIGALIFFYVGIIYCFLQSIITYYLYPEFNGKTIFWIRIIISILSLLSAISMSVLGKIGNKKWSSASHVNDFILRRPDEKGFLFVTLSSGAEWLVALTFILFFFSYIKEFQKIAIDVSIYPLVSHFDFDPMPMTSERIKLRAGMNIMLQIGMQRWRSSNHVLGIQNRSWDDKGFDFLTIAALLEWFVGALIVATFLSFFKEFKKIRIDLKIYPTYII